MEAGHFESVVYLRLWSGDVEGALQLATEKGELNDHLLSVAPMGTNLFAPRHASRLDRSVTSQQFVPLTPLSRVPGVEPSGGGLREAAVSAGAVPEGGVPPAVSQQAVRGRRAAALAQTLQVRPPSVRPSTLTS